MKVLTFCFVFFTLASLSVKGDTITFSTNESINGLITYKAEKFKIEATFRNDEKIVRYFDRKKVKVVEINRTTRNQGPPPSWINKYEDDAETEEQPQLKFRYPEKNTSEETATSPAPSTRPPADPGETQPGITSMIDETGNVVLPTDIPDEIKLISTTKKERGRLIEISVESIKLSVGNREISYSRDEVHSIRVGH